MSWWVISTESGIADPRSLATPAISSSSRDVEMARKTVTGLSSLALSISSSPMSDCAPMSLYSSSRACSRDDSPMPALSLTVGNEIGTTNTRSPPGSGRKRTLFGPGITPSARPPGTPGSRGK